MSASGQSLIEPYLPDTCEPTAWFYAQLSRTLHTCIPTQLAFVSTLLGCLSITSWLFAQMPQIYKNWSIQSTSGLSIFFLAEWLLGDLSNLLGCLLTGQATWQTVLASYYCLVDILMVGQWIWYEKLRHGRPLRKAVMARSSHGGGGDLMEQVRREEPEPPKTPPKPIEQPNKSMFRMPRFSFSSASARSRRDEDTDDENEDGQSPSGSPPQDGRRLTLGTSPALGVSPRTVLYVSMVLAVLSHTTIASPLSRREPLVSIQSDDDDLSASEVAGKLLSWLSALLYLGSRLPQLYKNFVRRSTSGLSPHLFIAAFFGNFFYSSSLLTNPSAWYDLPAYGGRGWADDKGTNRGDWILAALPFFLGAAGVLFMDAAVGVQFLVYGDGSDSAVKPIVVVEEDIDDGVRVHRRWRRVDGWMRGWFPSVSVAGTPRPGTPRSVGERSAGSTDLRTEVERTGLLSEDERQGLLIAGVTDGERNYSTM